MSKVRGLWQRKQRGLNVTRLMARDGNRCTICGEPLDRERRSSADPQRVSFDHILPRSHGGGSELANMRLAHAVCNSARGNDPLEET